MHNEKDDIKNEFIFKLWLNINTMDFKQLVQEYSYLLTPYTTETLNPDLYTDVDDMDAMISDVSGYLQQELRKRGCRLIIKFDNMNENIYSTEGVDTDKTPAVFNPQIIYPRTVEYS